VFRKITVFTKRASQTQRFRQAWKSDKASFKRIVPKGTVAKVVGFFNVKVPLATHYVSAASISANLQDGLDTITLYYVGGRQGVSLTGSAIRPEMVPQ
jgi:hypothetical protein